VHGSGVGFRDLGELWQLPLGALVLVGVLCALMYVTDVMRYRAFGRALGEHVSWRAAVDACVANFFFSWITPGAALGAPAAIYMLGRRGVSWEGATLIAFGKSLTGTALLVALAFVMMAAGFGPPLDHTVFAVFTSGVGIVAVLLVLPILGALWPERSLRAVARLEAWLSRRRLFAGPRMQRGVARFCEALRRTVERLAKLREQGAGVYLALLASHLVYFVMFVGIGVVLAVGFGAELGPAIGTMVVYAAFTYVAPTPGGAGLSEAVAVPFFGGILPAHDAVIVVLLFRALTFYLDVAIGIVYLTIVGGVRQILDRTTA